MLRRSLLLPRITPSLHLHHPHDAPPGRIPDSCIVKKFVSVWKDTRSVWNIGLANVAASSGCATPRICTPETVHSPRVLDPYRNKPMAEEDRSTGAKSSPPWPATTNSLRQIDVWKMNALRMDAYWNYSRAYSSTSEDEKKSTESASSSPPQRKSLDDFQHEEIVGPTVERDLSAVANELREALEDLRGSIKKCSAALLAVGIIHLSWGGAMFLALESPFSHAIMTQVCMSALVFFGLAYHLKQTLKPMAFFNKLEERSRLRIITLSLQVTKIMAAFFRRGYGIGLVLSFTLALNLASCVKVFFF